MVICHRRPSWKGMLFVMLTAILVTACTGGSPAAQPTAAGTPTRVPSATAVPATATAAATATPTPFPTDTPSPTPDTPAEPFTWTGQNRPLLMAHYMPWYQAPPTSGSWGWHWTMDHFFPVQKDGRWQGLASHYTPLTGPYDSSDEAILEYQVSLMKLSGIDGVIVDWYGNEDFWDYGTINASTGKLFTAIKKAGLKFAICYEDKTIEIMVDNGHIPQNQAVAHAQKVMRYLQDTWFKDDAYLKAGNQPVLFIFGPQYFKDGSDWKQIFSVVDPQPLFVTLDNRTDPVAACAFPWPPMWASTGGELSYDALKRYLAEFADKSKHWKYKAGGAFPGFYDIYKEANVGAGYGHLGDFGGKTFHFTLQQALDQKPDLIQLITWNDYGEGTIIEPTTEFAYRYLEMVQAARKATGPDFTYTAGDLRLPLELYNLRVKNAQDSAVMDKLNQASSALLSGDLKTAKEILDGIK